MRRFALGLAVAAVAGLIWLAWLNPTPAATGLREYVTGRSMCGLFDSIRAVQLRERQHRETWELTLASRKMRTDGNVTLFRTPLGDWWAPSSNFTGLQFGINEHRRKPYGSPNHGDVVLDCGANVGIFTRAALESGASLVVAIEPVPANVEALRRNFATEVAAGRVIIYPKGVWDKEDTLEMFLYDESQLDSFMMTSRPEAKTPPTRQALPLTTIDLLVQELRLSRVDFIKMDIEGAERRALRGATATIRRFKPRLAIATENLPDDPVTIPRTVRNLLPEYTAEPGACVQFEHGMVAPEIMFFH